MNHQSWSNLAVELSRLPGVADRLVRLHVPASDNCCKACTRPGVGTPMEPWPCRLYNLSTTALAARNRKIVDRLELPAGEPGIIIWSAETAAV